MFQLIAMEKIVTTEMTMCQMHYLYIYGDTFSLNYKINSIFQGMHGLNMMLLCLCWINIHIQISSY